MDSNVLLVIKADDRVNCPQKERKGRREFDSSFAVLLNSLVDKQVNRTRVGKKEIVESWETSGMVVKETEKVINQKAEKSLHIVKNSPDPLYLLSNREQKQKDKIQEKKVGTLEKSIIFEGKGKNEIKIAQKKKIVNRIQEKKVEIPVRNIVFELQGKKVGWSLSAIKKMPGRTGKRQKEAGREKDFSEKSIVTKSIRTEKLSENLRKKTLKLKIEKNGYKQLIQNKQNKERTVTRKKEVPVREGKVYSKVYKEHGESKDVANRDILSVKSDNLNSNHNISQEKSIDLDGFRTSRAGTQTLKEFVKSHYEPMEGVVRFYTEVSEGNSVRVLLNSRLGIAKLLFLSNQTNFQVNSNVIQNLVNTLNSLGFSNVAVSYNNYHGEGKNNGNQSFRGNRGSKFIAVAEMEPEEEELLLRNGIDIMV